MKLIKCYIENFGNLNKFSHDFAPGLNVITQPNGWGKSTLAAFIKAMFFGLPQTTKRDLAQNERKKYAPWGGGKFGGNMEFGHSGKRFRVERFFGAKESEDTFAMYDAETGKELKTSSDIGKRIFQIDAEAYERSVFFPQAGTRFALNDSLNAKLANLAENTDDINNYNTAIERLDKVRSRFKKTGGRGEIAGLDREIYELDRKITACKDTYRAIDVNKRTIEQKSARGTGISAELNTVKFDLKNAVELKEKNASKIAVSERYTALKKARDEAQREYDTAAASKNGKTPEKKSTLFWIFAVIIFPIAIVHLVKNRKKADTDNSLERLRLMLDMRVKDYNDFCAANGNIAPLSEVAAAGGDIEGLQRREAALQKEYDTLKADIALLGAQTQSMLDAAGALNEFEAAKDAKREQKLEYERKLQNIELTMEYLALAKDNMAKNYVTPMREAFGKYAAVFAGGDLDGHVMDTGLGLKFERYGENKSVEYLNAAHRDIADICVRLSLADALFTGEKPFLIMDDPFVNMDEVKTAAALGALKRLAEAYQIVYLTCHKSRTC